MRHQLDSLCSWFVGAIAGLALVVAVDAPLANELSDGLIAVAIVIVGGVVVRSGLGLLRIMGLAPREDEDYNSPTTGPIKPLQDQYPQDEA